MVVEEEMDHAMADEGWKDCILGLEEGTLFCNRIIYIC